MELDETQPPSPQKAAPGAALGVALQPRAVGLLPPSSSVALPAQPVAMLGEQQPPSRPAPQPEEASVAAAPRNTAGCGRVIEQQVIPCIKVSRATSLVPWQRLAEYDLCAICCDQALVANIPEEESTRLESLWKKFVAERTPTTLNQVSTPADVEPCARLQSSAVEQGHPT